MGTRNTWIASGMGILALLALDAVSFFPSSVKGFVLIWLLIFGLICFFPAGTTGILFSLLYRQRHKTFWQSISLCTAWAVFVTWVHFTWIYPQLSQELPRLDSMTAIVWMMGFALVVTPVISYSRLKWLGQRQGRDHMVIDFLLFTSVATTLGMLSMFIYVLLRPQSLFL